MEVTFNPDHACPRCMQENQNRNEVCPHCGFYLPAYKPLPHHLQMYTILKGRYLLGSVLGEGGFGITYCAYDLAYNRRVAIKELFIVGVVSRQNSRTALVDTSTGLQRYYQECRNKFLQEARVLQSLQDKSGVVDIYEYFQENDTAYIVMEYLDGVDLRTFLKENGGKISYESTFCFLRPIMKSMMEIHRSGIIHRDISPDNIRYLTNKRMKLMDFGSAKSTATEHSDSVMILFKPGYTPPEQYASGYMVGPWMDVYAMAATIYRCITGKTPKASVKRENEEDLDSPRSLGADISPEVEQVILRGMALDPEKRYLDMRAFYEALKAASPAPALSVLPNTPEPAAQEALEEGEPFQRGVVVYDEEYRKLLEDVDKKKKNYTWVYVLVVVELLLIVFFLYRLLQH